MAFKKKLKSLILRAGPLPVWRFFRRHELTILAIHGVMDEGVETRWTPLRKQLPRKQLDRVLGVLSKHYNLISVDTAIQHLNGDIAPLKHPLVLTFDDGYANNFRHALPILKRHQAPAVFYVVTNQIESQQPFWFDRLDYALQKAAFKKKTVHIRDQAIEIDNSSRGALKRSYATLRKAAKLLDDDLEMRDTLNAIAASIETDDESRLSSFCADDDWTAIADWETLKEANADELVTIGSHTVDHIRIGNRRPIVVCTKTA
ncbi:MAG: polysaccharide deacetylase family protein [Pseudomonadota bacterium]